jgi:hypothetical protein
MNTSIALALMSIPFAASFLGAPSDNEDLYILGYITALAFSFAAILLAGGYHATSLATILADLAPPEIR